MDQDPILAAFDHLVRQRGDRVLVVSPQRRATVAEVMALADVVKDRVGGVGLPFGSLVGLTAPNGSAFFAGYLGLRRAGFRVLLIDSPVPFVELDRIVLAIGAVGSMVVRRAWPDRAEDFEFRPSSRAESLAQLPAAVSTVRLSSGSTGQSCGIAHTSEALLLDDMALRRTMGLKDERVLAAIPLSHAYGFSSIFIPAITAGWVVVVPEGGGPFDPIAAASSEEVTFLPTVPAYLNSLLKLAEPPALPQSLRLVISAGAPLRPDTAVRFRETYARSVHVFYGASEVGGITFDRVGTAAERGTLGSVVEGVSIQLISEADEEPGTGVVVVESPSAAVGYFPEPDDRLQGGRFRTSDLGRFDGSELVLLGRMDDVINIRGKKVSPREVEAVLEDLPGVDEAIVVRLLALDGSGDVIQAVVTSREEGLTDAALIVACRSRLAAHKVPRRIRIVGEIPRTSRGKIDFEIVRSLLLEPGA
ncbi:MAG: class I adenylate-forming enzyme family protein [Thermoanaerobaculales bacterium]